jgi:hypothetical protein
MEKWSRTAGRLGNSRPMLKISGGACHAGGSCLHGSYFAAFTM